MAWVMTAFNVLNTFVFMTNTGFGFNDRVKEDLLKANGGTKVRVWAGQGPSSLDMTGHLPDFRTYNYDGQPIGTSQGNGQRMAAGGYVDVLIPNLAEYAHMEPYYLKMFAGGDDGVCISALAIEGPNENGMMFWPELLISCNHKIINELPYENGMRTGYEDSLTMVGKKDDRPKCLWFDRNFSFGLKLTELTLHLPDLIMADKKAKEWRHNKALFCKPTPRILPAENHNALTGVYDPIWTFNPPLEYNTSSGLEIEPARVLEWKHTELPEQLGYSKESSFAREDMVRKLTDLEWTPPAPPRRPPLTVHTIPFEEQEKEDFLEEQEPQNDDGFGPGHWVSASKVSERAIEGSVQEEEDLAMYNDARQLVVLNSSDIDADSATSRCTHRAGDSDSHVKRDPGQNPDYLSLDEEVYCDMLLKTMYPICTETITQFCFDKDLMMLRRLDPAPEPSWKDHDNAVLEGSENHKKRLRRKRAVEAIAKVTEENNEAAARGFPIKYRMGQPRPLWARPYHSSRVRVVHGEDKN